MVVDESSVPEIKPWIEKMDELNKEFVTGIKASTEEEVEKHMQPWIDEMRKSLAFDPAFSPLINEYRKNFLEKSYKSFRDAIKIIRNHRYYTSWNAEWPQERAFKELCLLQLQLPYKATFSADPLSGYYLLYLIHGNQMDLFDFNTLYQSSPTNDDKNNNRSHRFRTFKKALARDLGDDDFLHMTQENKYAKYLAHAYEYCKEIFGEFSPTSTQSSPFILLKTDTDGVFETGGLPELNLHQKILLFFQTVAYAILPPEHKLQAVSFTTKLDVLLKNVTENFPLQSLNGIFFKLIQNEKTFSTCTKNPSYYIYCLIAYQQKTHEYIKFRKYLQELQQNITPKGCQLYFKYKSAPIGWQKSFGLFSPHQLTPEEIEKCNNCTWAQFYKSNIELIDAFFPTLSSKDKEHLWNVARKAFIYLDYSRFDFDIQKDHVPKAPEKSWYKAHNINAKMTIDDLIPMMYLINTLKDKKAKDFWDPSYKKRHGTDSFGSMVRNIESHNYLPFRLMLSSLWQSTKSIFIKDFIYEKNELGNSLYDLYKKGRYVPTEKDIKNFFDNKELLENLFNALYQLEI